MLQAKEIDQNVNLKKNIYKGMTKNLKDLLQNQINSFYCIN